MESMVSLAVIQSYVTQFVYFFGMIRYTPVPHLAQTPFMAGRPFFMVTFWALLISDFALHFTQYAISAMLLPPALSAVPL